MPLTQDADVTITFSPEQYDWLRDVMADQLLPSIATGDQAACDLLLTIDPAYIIEGIANDPNMEDT